MTTPHHRFKALMKSRPSPTLSWASDREKWMSDMADVRNDALDQAAELHKLANQADAEWEKMWEQVR